MQIESVYFLSIGVKTQCKSVDEIGIGGGQMLCCPYSPACDVGQTVTEIMRQFSGNKLSAGQCGRTLQNDLRKVVELRYAKWLKDGSARRHQLRTGAEHF